MRPYPGGFNEHLYTFISFLSHPSPLLQAFKSSYAMHEILATAGRQLPWGHHPLDDYRQNLLAMQQGLDTRMGYSFNAQV